MKRWFRIAILNFFIAGLIGALLRYAFVEEVRWLDFRPFMHAHSHVAMLGWVYLALFILLVRQFVPDPGRVYTRLFWATQLSVLGMAIAFPIQGYGLVSIFFSTLHILLSYGFCFHFWRDMDRSPMHQTSRLFVRFALVFMILSTFALWGLGPVMALDRAHEPIYYWLVQAFLHFQFNGWFVFAALGLVFFLMEEAGIGFSGKRSTKFGLLLASSCLLTYSLAVTWSDPRDFLFLLNSIGAAIQLLALVFFIRLIYPVRKRLLAALGGAIEGWLIRIGLFCFGAKIIIQTVVIIPNLAVVAYTVRNFVIGFIHLILLGLMTHLLFGFASRYQMISLDGPLNRGGIILISLGFLLSEALLFLQGLALWTGLGFFPFYYESLFIVSVLIPLGLLLLLVRIQKPRITN